MNERQVAEAVRWRCPFCHDDMARLSDEPAQIADYVAVPKSVWDAVLAWEESDFGTLSQRQTARENLHFAINEWRGREVFKRGPKQGGSPRKHFVECYINDDPRFEGHVCPSTGTTIYDNDGADS